MPSNHSNGSHRSRCSLSLITTTVLVTVFSNFIATAAIANVSMDTGAYEGPDWTDFFTNGSSQIYSRSYSSSWTSNHGIFGNGWNSDYDNHIYVDGQNLEVDWGTGTRIKYFLTDDSRKFLNQNGIHFNSVSDLVKTWPTQLGDRPLIFQIDNAIAEGNASKTINLSSQGFSDDGADIFNLSGQMASTVGPSGPVALGYDSLGRLDTIDIKSLNFVVHLEYKGNVELVIHSDKPVNDATYIFDSQHNLISETNSWGNHYTYEYDSKSRLTAEHFPDNTSLLISYDPESGFVNQIIERNKCRTDISFKTGANGKPHYSELEYDCAGHRTTDIDTFLYYADNQLKSEEDIEYDNSQSKPTETKTTFDQAGNVLSKVDENDKAGLFDPTDPIWRNGVRLDVGDGALAQEPVRIQHEGDCGSQVAAEIWDGILKAYGVFDPTRPVSALWLSVRGAIGTWAFYPSLIDRDEKNKVFKLDDLVPNIPAKSPCNGPGSCVASYFNEGIDPQSSFLSAFSSAPENFYETKTSIDFAGFMDDFSAPSTQSKVWLCDEKTLENLGSKYPVVWSNWTIKDLASKIIAECKTSPYYRLNETVFANIDDYNYMVSNPTKGLVVTGSILGIGGASLSIPDDKSRVFFLIVNSILAGVPVAVTLNINNSTFLTSAAIAQIVRLNINPHEDHYVLIDGFRLSPFDQRPQFLIRNSWGKTCDGYNLSNFLQCDKEHGSFYIDYQDLYRYIDEINVVQISTMLEKPITGSGVILDYIANGPLVGKSLTGKTIYNVDLYGTGDGAQFKGNIINGVLAGDATLFLSKGKANCTWEGNFYGDLSSLGSGSFTGRYSHATFNGKDLPSDYSDDAEQIEYDGNMNGLAINGDGQLVMDVNGQQTGFDGWVENGEFHSFDKSLDMKLDTCGVK